MLNYICFSHPPVFGWRRCAFNSCAQNGCASPSSAATEGAAATVVDVLRMQPTKVTVLAGTTDAGFADGQHSAETAQNTSLLNFPQVRAGSVSVGISCYSIAIMPRRSGILYHICFADEIFPDACLDISILGRFHGMCVRLSSCSSSN